MNIETWFLVFSIFFPRFTILIFIAINLGISSPWFWIHFVCIIVSQMFNLSKHE